MNVKLHPPVRQCRISTRYPLDSVLSTALSHGAFRMWGWLRKSPWTIVGLKFSRLGLCPTETLCETPPPTDLTRSKIFSSRSIEHHICISKTPHFRTHTVPFLNQKPSLNILTSVTKEVMGVIFPSFWFFDLDQLDRSREQKYFWSLLGIFC